jgi:ankyrin repeat protein
MAHELPERPNLEQLKRQAKDLLRDVRARDAQALARIRALPAFAHHVDDARLAASVALHDAQSVVARELGFPSWKALVERVEELTLEFDAAVDRFVEAATEVQPERAERLLQLHPRIATANFFTALLLGDTPRVTSRLSDDATAAKVPGGARNWEPLLYLCHTSLAFGPDSRADGVVECARQLLESGADPDTRFPWVHHGVRRPALWGAVCVTRLLPLARILLEAGADPNDGVTLPLAAGGGDLAALELLRAHGGDVNQPWASDGASTLYSILNWSDTPDGVYWLLEHGADPDFVFEPNGEAPLHVVARRWNGAVADRLVSRGAKLDRTRRDGRTPYQVAQLSGNDDVAEWLVGHGAATELSEVDRFVAACSRGDRATAQSMLAAQPTLSRQIAPEHYGAFLRAAERGDAVALETMLECGFDPDHADDDIGKTALHAAAMEGWPDAVRTLLAHGASVSVRDREFHAQPLVWAAEGFRSHQPDHRNHELVGRLLLDAGSPVDWEGLEEPSEDVLEIIRSWAQSRARP